MAQAQTTPRYNIICMMTDDQDAASLPVMRHLTSYPHGSWVNFNNAVCNDAICAPSRACLLTGQYSHHHGVIKNGLGSEMNEAQSLPVWLKSAGYRTALFGKYQNGWGKGRHNYKPQGRDVFEGKGGLSDALVEPATGFIRNTNGPFFLCVNPVDPHFFAKPPARYKTSNVWVPPEPPSFGEDVSDKPS